MILTEVVALSIAPNTLSAIWLTPGAGGFFARIVRRGRLHYWTYQSYPKASNELARDEPISLVWRGRTGVGVNSYLDCGAGSRGTNAFVSQGLQTPGLGGQTLDELAARSKIGMAIQHTTSLRGVPRILPN